MSSHTNIVVKKIAQTFGALLPDSVYIRIRYFLSFHKLLNLKSPRTYNEKLQWMKLYDRNPLYTQLVDKYEVRSFIEKKIGTEYLIPCYGVWNSFDEIDFKHLPNEFVLKCTHDSGSVIICHNKKDLDLKKIKKHFEKCLKMSSFIEGREWAYKNVKPKIIAEKFMVDSSKTGLMDYKFFCFNGKVKSLFIATDRGVSGKEVKFDFFDENFNHLPFKHGHENAEIFPSKPEHFEEMKNIAEQLSAGMKHVRVDLYNVNGKVYFGEMTFYHHCGFVPFDPEEWDYKFGNWLRI